MKPIQIENFTFYNADNMSIMKTFKDKEFDLAIVDKINVILLLLYQSIFVSLYQIKTYKYDTRFKTVTNWQSRRISCLR